MLAIAATAIVLLLVIIALNLISAKGNKSNEPEELIVTEDYLSRYLHRTTTVFNSGKKEDEIEEIRARITRREERD